MNKDVESNSIIIIVIIICVTILLISAIGGWVYVSQSRLEQTTEIEAARQLNENKRAQYEECLTNARRISEDSDSAFNAALSREKSEDCEQILE